MSYPFSISKIAIIKNDEAERSINLFKTKLNKINGTTVVDKGNEIAVKECIEFSSRFLRIKNLNKGKITFTVIRDEIIVNIDFFEKYKGGNYIL